jgi:vesicle-fusing ATPase
MNIRQNLFGQGPKAGREQQGGYGRPPQPPARDDTPMGGYQENARGQYGGGGYNAPPSGAIPPQGMPQRTAVGRPSSQQQGGMMGSARRVQLRIAKVEDKTLANQYIFGNL